MRTVLCALAAVAAVSVFNTSAARAQNYPFCLANGPGPGDCKYDTYEQCMATASGTGKYCQPNTWLPQASYGGQGYGGQGYGAPGYGPRTPRPRGYGPPY